ncbi:hypothetical protein GJ496_011982, partial [Pomphorhynchus laevis]
DLVKVLKDFYQSTCIRQLCKEHGLDNRMFQEAFASFRRYCLNLDQLPVDLHVVISDMLLSEAGNCSDILPYFIKHSREVFPHMLCLDDLKKISDLQNPPDRYPLARNLVRKITYHAGPTNSGKTYKALNGFLKSMSGIYCGPLKLLASEVFIRSNKEGTPCDLITGEERRYPNLDNVASNHQACTIEMASINKKYDVAIIDEIQMIRDLQRGWAWTRALLGICADEVHLCGEEAAIPLVEKLIADCGDEMQINHYKRLTPLVYLNEAVESFDNIRKGDCIVCFSKKDIYSINRELDSRNIESAVIYGSLPPGTKLAQSKKFNDPDDPCNVLIATDAIGMGLNLNIKRIVFYSLSKPQLTESGDNAINIISPSQAMQIAGRAGRFNTQFEDGEVTTFRSNDLSTLKGLVLKGIDDVKQAGIHPTADQMELFAYHLPKHSLSDLLVIFMSLTSLNGEDYFLCNVDDLKFLASLIDHVPLELKARYIFCCAPISKKVPFVCTMFLKFARMYSRHIPVKHDWLLRQIGWPFKTPSSLNDLAHLEAIYDVCDLYLWLGYRFPDIFGADSELVRDTQRELDAMIEQGVSNMVRLLKRSINSLVNESELTDFQQLTPNEKFIAVQCLDMFTVMFNKFNRTATATMFCCTQKCKTGQSECSTQLKPFSSKISLAVCRKIQQFGHFETRTSRQFLWHLLFVVVFTVPYIRQYGIPRRIILILIPFLEQLDRGMQYKRRSMIDHDDLDSFDEDGCDYDSSSSDVDQCKDGSVTHRRILRRYNVEQNQQQWIPKRRRNDKRPRLDNIDWSLQERLYDDSCSYPVDVSSFDFLDDLVDE